jgi:hypothetical protein
VGTPTNSNNVGVSLAEIQFTGTLAKTPYADWASSFTTPVTGGFDDDDDGDGTPNSHEWYYFNSDPTVAGGQGSALVGATSTGPNTFEFTHQRPLERDDATEAYVWSSDLNTWRNSGGNDGTYTVDIVGSGDGGNPYETVTVTATVSGGTLPGLFVRQILSNP